MFKKCEQTFKLQTENKDILVDRSEKALELVRDVFGEAEKTYLVFKVCKKFPERGILRS